ncbi:MAG: DUF167 domain-containing protein [Lentisphaeria bacterium]|nr:DUF167 domain-containing protein [Lentisphaeria bacterium]
MTERELLPALRETSDGAVVLTLRVQPGAKCDGLSGLYGERSLKVAVSAPPVDGKANAALRRLLARWLGVPQAQIELKNGLSGRDKQFVVSGVSRTETARKLAEISK